MSLKFDFRSLAPIVALLLLAQSALSAVYRYYVSKAGLPFVYNAPDVAALALVVFGLASWLLVRGDRYKTLTAMLVLIIIMFSSVVGYLNHGSVIGVISAIKMVSFAVFGLLFFQSVKDISKYKAILWLIYISVCVGIYLDQFTDFPWSGFKQDVFGVEKAATKVWWAGGKERIAGFSANSTSAAFVILVCHYFLSHGGKMLSRIFMLALYAVSLYFINLTTSKTALVCCSLLAMKDIFILIFPKATGTAAVNFLAYSLIASVAVIPLVSVTYIQTLTIDHSTLLYSWYDRSSRTWIEPLVMMGDISPISYILGLGLGMVDFPIHYTAKADLYIPYDNFLLGCAMMFGIPFALFVYYLMIKKVVLLPTSEKFFFAVLCVYGVFIGGHASPLFSILMGSFLGYRAIKAHGVQAPRARTATDPVKTVQKRNLAPGRPQQ